MNQSICMLAAASFLTASGYAQGVIALERTTNLKDAGVYHVATGTWTRGSTVAFSSDTIYNNTADSGYYGNMGVTMSWTDAGTIPSNSHGGCTDSYHVDGFQVGYCTQEGQAGTGFSFEFYELLASCTSPFFLEPAAGLSVTGPGSSALGITACWLVTFDLQGTSLEFDLSADGDGVYDGWLYSDTFGFTYRQVLTAGYAGGPLLRGDPNNVPFGDDTYYQNPGASAGGSGLGQQDQFWLVDTSGCLGDGCYWFGGYGPGVPWTGWHLEIYADRGTGCLEDCERFCTSNPNSTGAAALIQSLDGCDEDGDGVISMQASPVPNQPGIFFHGTSILDMPFGCGRLCTAASISRGGVVFASGNVARYDFHAGAYGIQPGDGNFQYWYRDPAHAGVCGSVFNTSDAMRY